MNQFDPPQPPPLPPAPPPGQPGYGHVPPPPPRTGFWANFFPSCLAAGCAAILAPVLLVGGFLVVAGYVLSAGMDEAMNGPLAQFGRSDSNVLTRTLRAGDADAGTIAVVSLQGSIDGSGSPLDGDGMMAFVSEQLRLAGQDDDVKAVILQIDSPGGGLTASDHIHSQVTALRKSGKPVIAWAGSMMASGGYYVAVAADRIMASPTATVGSIGVILQHFQAEELLKSLGVRVNPVTSGAHKDLGSPFREMTPEERKILQQYVDIAHSRFVSVVAAGRNMPEEEVRAVADGTIMSAGDALEKGLVDSVGYIEDAVALVESDLGGSGMRIIGYRRVFSLSDAFSEAGASAAGAAVKALRSADAGAKVMAE